MLNLYYIDRNFCSPSGFYIIAESKKEAIKISNKNYGYTKTKATIKKFKKGVLLSNSVTFI